MPYELRMKNISVHDIDKLGKPWLMAEKLEDSGEATVIVQCMYGWGDSVYTTIGFNAIHLAMQEDYQQRGITKPPYFYAITPLPQLFSHLPYVRCVKPKEVELRTQGKNSERKDLQGYWHTIPVKKEDDLFIKLAINYFERFEGDDHWSTPGNMLLPIISGALIAWDLRRFPMQMTLPRFDVQLPEWSKSPYVLLRPNVIRKEWPATARNCKSKYLKSAVSLIKKELGIPIVSIADTEPDREWIEQTLPSDYQYHKGEMCLEQMCELVHRATLCLGSQGFISPFSMAAKTNCIIILGGAGYENHPKRLTHPKLDTSTVKFIMPDPMCECHGIRHEGCNKTIVNFDDKFVQAMRELGL